MVNLWHKYQKASRRKKQTLHSLFAGFLFFCILYLITTFISIPLCPVQNIFGVSCLGCGLTRGVIAILRLDFKAAVQYHILSIPIFLGILFYAVFCFTDILCGWNNIERIEKQCGKKYMLILYFMILVLSTLLNHHI